MPGWEFAKLEPNVQRREAFEDSFFIGQGEGEEDGYGDAEHLVRETVQNAIDAKHDNSLIVMRFAVYAPPALDQADTMRKAYFNANFQAHSIAAKKGQVFSQNRRAMRWLVVEDFATHGLRGPTDQTLDSPAGEPGHEWYWYFFRVGQSGKTGQNLGRWGLGKTVLARQSKINATFTLTVRADDRQKLLMGLVVQPTHEIDGDVYGPDAFWCDRGLASTGRPRPVGRAEDVSRFETLFRTQRDDHAGTSIVVPYCHEALTGHDVVRAAIVNFFMRFVRNADLEVQIQTEERKKVSIEKASLPAAIASVRWPGKGGKAGEPPPLDLAEVATRTDGDVLVANKASLLPDAFESSALDAARKSFAAGEIVRVRVPLDVQLRGATAVRSSFDVLLRINDARKREGKQGRTYFIREGMTLTGENAGLTTRGLEAIVLLDEGAVCGFVGDAEDPSHQHFDQRDKIRAKYAHGSLTKLDAIRKCVVPLVVTLNPPNEGIRRDLLADFFAQPKLGLAPIGAKRRPGSERIVENSAGETFSATPRWWTMNPIESGFRVARDHHAPRPVGTKLLISCAYELNGGAAIRNWSPIDFDFRSPDWPLPLATNANVSPGAQGNELLLEPLSDEFEVKVPGFYPKLELLVRINEVSAEGAHD